MRFTPSSKADKKAIKKALHIHNKTYTYGVLGMKKLPFKTVFKKDLQFLFSDIFPQRAATYTLISSAVFMSGLVFYICDLKMNVNELNKECNNLIEMNVELSDNIEGMSLSVIELDQETKVKEEIIQKQKEEILEIENSIDDISSEKDATLKDILDMINKLDIFNTIVSRSDNLYSATNQIQEAKAIIKETLGDSEDANKLIDKLENEQEKIEDHRRRYPDYKPASGRLSSRFGYRRDPFTGQTRHHNGIDIAASTGTSVFSAAYGTVTSSGYETNAGNFVVVNHGNGYQTKYFHLSKILVTKGQIVNKGERIGHVGNTGRSTGPHLHFEIHLWGSLKNPLEFVYFG